MATDASGDFAFLAAAARRSLGDLRRLVEVAPSAPGRRGSSFVAVVAATIDALEAGVGERERDFAAAADDHERRAVIRDLRRIIHDVTSLHFVTPWIESTRVSTLGAGLIYLVDEMVAALLKEQADVVMTPSSEQYMYSTLPKPFEDALVGLGVPYPGGPAPVIVAYPVHEPDSLFLHLIIAHEIGHSAVTEHLLVEEVWQHDPDRSATGDLLNAAAAEHLAVEGGTPAESRAKIRAIFRSWLTELLCDALAGALLGPSFLFTAAAFSTPFGGPEPSDTHPPFTLRARLLLEHLDEVQWSAVLTRSVPNTFKWIADNAARPQLAGRRTYYLRLEEALTRLAPTLRKVMGDHLAGGVFVPPQYEPLADELATLLNHDVLPAQLHDRSPVPPRAIIFGGWLHAFRKHGDEPVKLAEVVADRDQQRFLTKGIEMSVVLGKWIAP